MDAQAPDEAIENEGLVGTQESSISLWSTASGRIESL